jgi:hypothetical protein
MADRFGLDKLRNGVQKRAEELAHEEKAQVRSYDEPRPNTTEGPFQPFTFQGSDFDRTEPDKDEMRKYFRHFETTPFVRKSITSFARQVMEPGYYVEARDGADISDEMIGDLEHWMTQSAIIEGEFGQDFRQLAKKAIVQQEVRGTSFIEIAPYNDDPDMIAGLKLINAETMEAVTRPGQSILLQPEDVDKFESAPAAESGGAAAYLQDLGETETFFGTPVSGHDRGIDNDRDDDFKVGFREDEIIKLARDADAGEIFGTSRLEAVSDRIEGLRQKLSDNDKAIASKAYPLWLFMFGSEESPWQASDINQFMEAHEMENFNPGMKQGVRGDVSVETLSGDVAEISEALSFDIEWIMSIMPIPKFAIGAFSSGGVGQFGGVEQQQQTQRQIKDTRREIEEKFTPVLRQVAMQNGLDEKTADKLRLKVGSPGEPETEVARRENIIRYVSGSQEGSAEGTEDDERMPDVASAASWHTDRSVAELSLSDKSELSDAIFDMMLSARDDTLEEVAEEYENSPAFAASKFERVANDVLRHQFSGSQFGRRIRPMVEEMVGSDKSFSHSNKIRFFVQDIENSTENALEEMLRLMRTQFRRAANSGESVENVVERVENKYNIAKLRERAELIAHMETRNAEETLRV